MRDSFLHLLFFLGHHVVRGIAWILFKPTLKLKIQNRENIPSRPYIICSNHSSHLDGILISIAISDKIRWMITRKHYENSKTKWLYDAMRLIPVNTEGLDNAALRESMKGLRAGDVLGIFPEGTRSKDGKVKTDVHSGAAYLSIKSGVVILPIGINGSYHVLPPGTSEFVPHPVQVNIGKPMIPPEDLTKDNIDTFIDDIMNTIKELMLQNK